MQPHISNVAQKATVNKSKYIQHHRLYKVRIFTFYAQIAHRKKERKSP